MSSNYRNAKRADRVHEYARKVVDGVISAGKPVRMACARHLRDLKEQKARGIEWRQDAAEAILVFAERVVYIDEGKPLKLHDFQAFILGMLFGWYNSEGYRRFRTAYIEMGKGNGQTPLAAVIGLYALVVDDETAPEVYSAATTREQASICFKDAVRMVGQSPELAKIVRRRAGVLEIASRYATFRPLSAEHRGLDGKRPHVAIVDELHEHPNALVVDKIAAGKKNRLNSLVFEITNSGYDRNSVCYQHREYSLKVLEDVVVNEEWFSYVCALDEGDDWHDSKTWIKANPGLGTILPESYLRQQVTQADGMPTMENIVKRLNFCIWTEQANRAIPMHLWDAGGDPFDPDSLRGRECYGGIDLARVNDLSALVLVFPPVDADEKWKALAWFWVPEDNIHTRATRDRVPYDVWRKQGFIRSTEGNTTDVQIVKRDILEIVQRFDVVDIGLDMAFGGDELFQGIKAEWKEMKPFRMGMLSMAPPTFELMRLLMAGEFQHGGNPVLRWNASNLATEQDAAGNIKPSKEKSSERIDGITALVVAIGMAMKRPAQVRGEAFFIPA